MTAAGDNVEKVALTETDKKNDVELGASNEADVQFSNGKFKQSSENVEKEEFVGLSKQELEKYAKDPYWVKVRLILLIGFWLGWFALLATAIAIICLAPKCPVRPNLEWWQKSPMYQIVPQSFKDSNNDGIGDLKGIEEKIDYLRETANATALLLSSIYQVDEELSVIDYKSISDSLGLFTDFENLRISAHKKGIKLILDFIPNHTSRNHTWFTHSRECLHGEGSYCDFYVWHPGTTDANGVKRPPNDWKNFYGQSAWTLDEKRKEFYYHYYLPGQPDLNLRSAAVKQELKDVLQFWISKKVDGFRVNDVEHLIEANVNSTSTNTPIKQEGNCGYVDQKETFLQPETFALLTEWRSVLDEHSSDRSKRVLFADVENVSNATQKLFTYESKPGLHIVFTPVVSANCIKCTKDRIAAVQSLHGDSWAGWMTGNENLRRIASLFSGDYSSAVNLLLMTLFGTSRSYYGEEIGMKNGVVSWNQGRDKLAWGESKYTICTRDLERTPMQWSADMNAGFSSVNNTWLPVGTDYKVLNVLSQQAIGAGHTTKEIYTSLTSIGDVPSIQWGTTKLCESDEYVVSYIRNATGFKSVFVAVNLGTKMSELNIVRDCGGNLPTQGSVIANTGNLVHSELSVGLSVDVNYPIILQPKEGFVMEWLTIA